LAKPSGSLVKHLGFSASERFVQAEAVSMESQPVTPGMRGKVISLHDGFHLDVVQGKPIPPEAIVRFDSGIRLMVDERMQWEAGRWLNSLRNHAPLASMALQNCLIQDSTYGKKNPK